MGGAVGKNKHKKHNENVIKSKNKILMLGNDAAGKTTILYKSRLGEITTTIPTIGFNLETVKFNNYDLIVWDVGGKDKIRPLWRHYYNTGVKGLIFVIDSIDRERITTSPYRDPGGASYEFHKIMSEISAVISEAKANQIRILFFANKQDLPNAMGVEEIMEKMDLAQLVNEWIMVSACAVTGEGLAKGFKWIIDGQSPDSFDEGKSWYSSQTYKMITENKKKSILFISGWVRNIDNQYQLHISVDITALIHTFHIDVDSKYDRLYKFYG